MFYWDFLWFLVLDMLKHLLPCENAESAGQNSFYIIKFSGQIYVSILQLKDLSLIFLEWLLLDQNIFFSTALNYVSGKYL